MIIDSHEHIGDCRVFSHEVAASELIDAMDKNGVDASLVMPFPGASDEISTHNAISALSREYKGRIFGVISINPHIEEQAYFSEVERCVKDLGFVGLKLHPFGHACPVSTQDANKIFEAAQLFNIPLIIHSGLGAPYACPAMFMPRARQYPNVQIVVAHSGAYIYSAEAIILAQECPNVFLETSWCAPHRIKEFVDTLGAERVMMGSDIYPSIATELAKYHSCGLSDDQLETCLYRTAKNVFRLDI